LDKTATLTPADFQMFDRLRIGPELVARAGITRVTDLEARQEFGLTGSGDNSGLVFPYVNATGIRNTCRLRRDRPDHYNSVTVPAGPWHGSEAGRVTISDILIHGIGKPQDRLTQADRSQVVRCLTHHGWTRKQERSGSERGKRFYVKADQ